MSVRIVFYGLAIARLYTVTMRMDRIVTVYSSKYEDQKDR